MTTDFTDEETKVSAPQTWWLSFADESRPEGSQFVGVAIVDVTEEDAAEADEFLRARRAEKGLVTGELDERALYIGGALRVAHLMACNPGTAVQATRIDQLVEFPGRDIAGRLPRNRLMSMAELKRVGALD